MTERIQLAEGPFICGDAGRAQKLIGTVVMGADAQWWEVTTFKTRRNPISVEYIGYGKPVADKTALLRLAAMVAKKQIAEAKWKIENLAIQPGREIEMEEARLALAAAEARLAKTGKQAEKVQDGLLPFVQAQYRQMREPLNA